MAKFTLKVGDNFFESFFYKPSSCLDSLCIEPLTIDVSDNMPAEGDFIRFAAPNMKINNTVFDQNIKIRFNLEFLSTSNYSIFNNTRLPLFIPDLEAFNYNANVTIETNDGDAVKSPIIRIVGQLNELTVATIPAPPTIGMLLLALIGLSFLRDKKLKC
ncbi:hypothetical protein [Alishewanella sp. HL-SH05]|uniref:hypothetical protein n=1 Tax=Alishewanella sp. HL-SH05 TaxID=3461145 RepID=UPI00404179DB